MRRLRIEPIVGVAALALALALSTGCGVGGSTPGGTGPSAGSGSTAATSPGESPRTESAGEPSNEPTGPESPQATQANKPSISVPALPIGGGSDADEAEQCVRVSYLGDDELPPGVRISLTAASFAPPLFELGGSACSGRGASAPCLSEEFAFTAENTGTDAGTCILAVRVIGGDDFESADLSLAGRVQCPAGEDALCAHVADQLGKEDETIGLDVGDRPDETGSPSPSPTPSASPSPSTDASDPTASPSSPDG